MKKVYLAVLLSLISVFLLSSTAQAYRDPVTGISQPWGPACDINTHIDLEAGKGLVPCGQTTVCRTGTGKESKEVPCNTCDGMGGKEKCLLHLKCPCEFGHIFIMMKNIFDFAVFKITIPLAAFFVVVGGILLLVSGGNPGLADRGKAILKSAAIALLLVFGSWLIINTVLTLLGYSIVWWQF
ncbi:hypothetical protein KW786_03875 [Candidatus Parcubacteria bacterium]|nr:hypothetical protein [Candidatus Parcubacteria bacterium]